MEMSSEDLGKKLEMLNDTIEAQRKARHENNNRIAAVFASISKSVLELDDGNKAQMSAMLEIGSQVANLRSEVGLVRKVLTELDHILRGVDGQNGLRGEWKQMKPQLRNMELRLVGLIAIFATADWVSSKILF